MVEPKYTKNISSTIIKNKILEIGTSPENRVSRLKRLWESKKIVRILESHNALTGLIIENLKVQKLNLANEKLHNKRLVYPLLHNVPLKYDLELNLRHDLKRQKQKQSKQQLQKSDVETYGLKQNDNWHHPTTQLLSSST